jgi:hypothetical protein
MAYRDTEINEGFPVAGIDNESQGFRDNFSAIKDSLAQAKSDVVDLQTSRLNVNDLETDLSGNTIFNAKLRGVSSEFNSGGNIVSRENFIDFNNGAYQLYTLADPSPSAVLPIEFTFNNLPDAGSNACIRVHLYGNGAKQYFTFNSEVAGDIKFSNNAPVELSVTSTSEPEVYEFVTNDGGNNCFVRYLGTFTSSPKPFTLLNVDTADRNLLTPAVGTMIFNLDTLKAQVCTDAAGPTWEDLN